MTVETSKLIQSCLYNWLGYGNPDSTVWFVGYEEGGAEIWRTRVRNDDRVSQSLHIRKSFHLAMNFHDVWCTKYGLKEQELREIVSRGNVWRYIVVFLHFLISNTVLNAKAITEGVMAKEFGSSTEDYFICEMLPLPKIRRNHFPSLYTQQWASIIEYHRDVIPKRLEMIVNEIVNRKRVKLVISFDKDFTMFLLVKSMRYRKLFPTPAEVECAIYQIELDQSKSVIMLAMPFFGQGLKYSTVKKAATKVKEYL